MPIKIAWLVENRVSYFKYMGDVSVEEIAEASQIGLDLLLQSDAPLIHSIQDSSDVTSFPKQVGKLFKSVRESLSNDKMGWMLSVGVNNEIIQYVATLVCKLTRTRYRLFSTLDDAREFLKYVDTTLPDLSDFPAPHEGEYLYHVGINAAVTTEDAGIL